MVEEKLLDHVISRLESQLLDYVEENWLDTRVNNRYYDNSRPQRESNRFGGQAVGDNRRFDSRRRSGQSDHRFNNQCGRQGGSRNGAFRGQNGQDRVKQGIIDYHIEKILQEGAIWPIQSPYASPVVLTRKNNGLPPDSPEVYRFAVDYRKLNAITKYLRYPLPVIEDLITNIPHTAIMSTLDLKSGYFQLAINRKDIEKTAFITRNGTFAFLRMPFGLSGAAPNFQKAIDIILKPVLRHFVSFYMDDVIITSPSFNEHIDHLNQVFTLLQDAGLTLNKDKCHLISKDGIKTDNDKVKGITEMNPPKNNKEVSKFLGMAGCTKN
ncbi:retrovirus-related Pol polyprotein from transposon 297 [Trichonephila clavipes]|nr:retrovirus-related Pol polyprotein from transposon 297 [Trichonephila clavipes]